MENQRGPVFEGIVDESASTPTPERHRIAALDYLRGFALLGILVLNIGGFSGPHSLHDIPIGTVKPAFVGWHAHLDMTILMIEWIFFEAKMRGLFSILFGAGCVLLTERLERKNLPAADIFLRRNMWLALFGLLHGTLIWDGDILLSYALCALLFLYPLRHVASRTLIGTGFAIWLIGGTWGVAQLLDAPAAIHAEALHEQAVADQAAAHILSQAEIDSLVKWNQARKEAASAPSEAARLHTQPYLEGLQRRANRYLDYVIAYFRSGVFLAIVGCMMTGMGLYKAGFLSGGLSSRTYFRVALSGYAICLPVVIFGLWQASRSGFSRGETMKWVFLPYTLEQAAGTIADTALLLLLFKSGLARHIVAALKAVGRTAFSNYILTSLICQTLFVWSSLKWYGSLEYYQEFYVVAAVWLFNMVASSLWLRIFSYGPLEWIWRSLTYWRRPPMLSHRKISTMVATTD